MPRLLGIDIPGDKRIEAALPYIYGIGPARAKLVLEDYFEMGVANTHRLQLTREQGPQDLLLIGGWTGRGGRVRLGVEDHVAQKALSYGVGEPWE